MKGYAMLLFLVLQVAATTCVALDGHHMKNNSPSSSARIVAPTHSLKKSRKLWVATLEKMSVSHSTKPREWPKLLIHIENLHAAYSPAENTTASVAVPTCPKGAVPPPPFDEGNCYPVSYHSIIAPLCPTNIEVGCEAGKIGDVINWAAKTADAAKEARGYWKVQGYESPHRAITNSLGHVEVLFSFGAKDNVTDEKRSGFARIMSLSEQMLVNEVVSMADEGEVTLEKVQHIFGTGEGMGARYYVDAKALRRLPGSYWMPGTSLPGPFTLNIWWREYYIAAMERAGILVFLLSAGWFNSKWCGEELDWALARRVGETNLVVFMDAVAKAKFELVDEAMSESKATKAKWRSLLGSKGLVHDVLDLSNRGANTPSIDTISRVIKIHLRTHKQRQAATGEDGADGGMTAQVGEVSVGSEHLALDLASLRGAIVSGAASEGVIAAKTAMLRADTLDLTKDIKSLKSTIRAHVTQKP